MFCFVVTLFDIWMTCNDRIRGRCFWYWRDVGGRGAGGFFQDNLPFICCHACWVYDVASLRRIFFVIKFCAKFRIFSFIRSNYLFSTSSGPPPHTGKSNVRLITLMTLNDMILNTYIFLLTCTESAVVRTIIKGPLSVCIVSTHSFLVYMTIRFDVLTRWYWGCWTFIKQIHISLKQQLTLPRVSKTCICF